MAQNKKERFFALLVKAFPVVLQARFSEILHHRRACHSTVTDLARFLGQSMSQPRESAVS